MPPVDEDHAPGSEVADRCRREGGQLWADRLCGVEAREQRPELRGVGFFGVVVQVAAAQAHDAVDTARTCVVLGAAVASAPGATTSANPDHAAPDTVPAASNARKVRRSRGLGKAPNGSKEAAGARVAIRGWSAEGAELARGGPAGGADPRRRDRGGPRTTIACGNHSGSSASASRAASGQKIGAATQHDAYPASAAATMRFSTAAPSDSNAMPNSAR